MSTPKFLIALGAVLLIAGLATAFLSSHYTTRVMGEARKGVAVLAPEPQDPAWKEKERLLKLADRWFYVGLGLTAVGVVLQTWGSLRSLSGNRR